MGYIYLKNYAEWYYTKYFPSRAMLREKMLKKEPDEAIVDKVLSDLAFMIVEKNNIESRVHAGIQSGRPLRYIRTKLMQKKFDKILLGEILESYASSFQSPELYQKKIEQFIQKRKNQNTAKRKIEYELKATYPELHDLIEQFLSDYDDREALNEKIPALLGKYTQEKVLQKCMQAGFSSSDVYAVLRRL